jgi:glucose/arabinose dehydrogenase
VIINSTCLPLIVRLVTIFSTSYLFAVTAIEPNTRPFTQSSIPQPHLVLSAPIGGFERPIFVTGAGDGSNRLFVVDEVGRIHIVKNGAVLSTPFLDITNRVRYQNGFGLMSLAFPPGNAGKDHFYVYYQNLSGNPEIARFRVTANPDIADANSRQVVLTVTVPVGANHIGGHIAFSPRDGYLYLAVGDGEPGAAGSEGDPLNRAQNPAELLGKMLRVDVETANPVTYTIPASNPFINRAGYRPEIWALGLRNPWRFSFDHQTVDLYIGDNGQDLYEEVDFQPASSAGGENYGWRIMEGNHCYVPSSGCSTSGLTLPILEFAHTSSCASVIGGFVYRGSSFPGLQGIYLYLDYCTGKISGIIQENNTWQNNLLVDTNLPNIFASFGEDEQGNIYVVGTFNGSIYQIQDACLFTLASPSVSLSAAAGTGSVNFTAAAGACGWTASSNASFLTITSPASGSGNGTVSYSVALNTGSTARSGTLTIGGQTFTVNQAAPQWEGVVLAGGQTEIKTWIYQGRTYAYLKLLFPNAGYRVINWGQATRAANDFTADAAVEKFTGASVQAVSTTAQIYDLGPLANGTYNFNFKTSGTLAKTLQFTVSSTVPPPNPIDDARQFVKQQYRDFLNREADPAGEDFWTDNITRCIDPARRPPGQTVEQCTLRQRETTSGAFFLSPEFQYTGYFVYRMYQGALGRQPKLSEFITDVQFVGNGIIVNGQLSAAKINQNKAAFAQQFVNCTDATKYRCAEFKAIYDGLTNPQFVDKLFQTTGVNASATDRIDLVNSIGASQTRGSIVQKVVDGINVISEGNQQFTTTYGQAFYNSELNRAFVLLEYFGYMKRDPDDAGYAFWLGKLNQFSGNFVNAEMVLAFISSPEYRSRFGQP